jgi:hypothetical protein
MSDEEPASECSGLDVAGSVKSLHAETPVVLITGRRRLVDPGRLRETPRR